MGHPVVRLLLEGEPYWKFYSNREGQFIKSFIQFFEIDVFGYYQIFSAAEYSKSNCQNLTKFTDKATSAMSNEFNRFYYFISFFS